MSSIDVLTLPLRSCDLRPDAEMDRPGSDAPVRLEAFFERTCDAMPEAIALVCDGMRLSYAELDARANRAARLLIARNVCPGQRVGILLHRSVDLYVALLATLKAGAVFVPLDPSFPDHRVGFIVEDAGISVLITDSRRAAELEPCAAEVLAIDVALPEAGILPATRPRVASPPDSVCYIIYTSGTTGRPKGVVVNHSNVSNFLNACGPIYRYAPGDRVFQGMTIAFDFSIEEIWPSWAAGATVVAGPNDHRRLGSGLNHFLIEQGVTVLCCVPTLLATLDRDVPSLRLLLVGGEACPADLVRRWSKPGRRMLNTYGPTETTVTATWTELMPGEPVTIGRPLPTYTAYILDSFLNPVEPGTAGELCVGGPGVAEGYLNRPDLTAIAFVADPWAGRSDARLYRTGDLCRLTAGGEIEYLGRIDGQVKIRGYRIELSEIESVLMEHPRIEMAVVTKLAHEAGEDLVAYAVLREKDADIEAVRQELHDSLRRRLPAYMVPGYLELLDGMPVLPSGKADRARLPAPGASARLVCSRGDYVPPATPLEREVAAAWTTAFGQVHLSVDADFFLELGGHSLFAAGVISRLRRLPGLGHLGISDLYAHPTIRSLSRHIESVTGGAAVDERQAVTPRLSHGRMRVWRCGLAQVSMLYLLLAGLAAIPAAGLRAAHGLSSEALLVGVTVLGPLAWITVSLLLPVLVKWTLIGRFRAGRYPLWGAYYCRWWVVRKVCALAPLQLLAGSPLLAVYLRLLGARIGRNAHIATSHVDCYDLLAIGDNASVGHGVELQPGVVENGWLSLSPIAIGTDGFVGTNCVLMPGATLGDASALLEQSLVTGGQSVPAGQTWAGSPSAQVAVLPAALSEMASRRPPVTAGSPGLLCAFAASAIGLELLPFVAAVPGVLVYALSVGRFGPCGLVPAALLSGPLFVLTVCTAVAVLKRVLTPAPTAGIFPLYSAFGLRRWASDKLMDFSLLATNALYATLYTPPWLRMLGARVGPRSEISTVSHIEPGLLTLGRESFVADIATIGAATYHRGWIGLGAVELGSRCFVGNAATIPAGSRLGDDTLIGVHSVPPSAVVQDGTSWLGSPAIFLPRRQPSGDFDESLTYRPTRRRVASRLIIEFLRIVLPSLLLYLMLFLNAGIAIFLSGRWSVWHLAAVLPAVYLGSGALILLLVVLAKWALVGRYRPRVEPLWATFVRRSELVTGLYECAAVPAILGWLTGTPLLPAALRLFGVRAGRGVFLDTTYLTEFDLVSLEAGAQVGARSSLQTHLFEDRVMKMSFVTIGREASVGPRAVVLYDSVVESGACLGGLSLVMKGESLPAGTRWRGIPARLCS